MKNITLFILAIFTLLVCTSSKPIKTKPNEAIVFGRFILDNNSDIDHEKIELQFLRSPRGTAKVKVGKDGFFCLKMQIGNTLTDFIQYKDGGTFRKILTNSCLTLSFNETDKVYYVGDIFMKWTPTDRDKIKKGFSLGVGMGNNSMGGSFAIPIGENYTPGEDCPEITIREMQETIDQFHQIYPDDNREVIIQFMDLN
ncbi:hypothetical protein [Dysgonomonas sp. HGC4]|uniref:hypothetical protein n=1 Tax=Dysgonomonas sp. HGC4 TaxID=1658009 RepID=UPI000680216E|nr:hypothetical protein [Dysgonomonas sp. HGC4]MBD8346663.1 hypothetical protein [Dysgonomonas sp. HGC4]